MAASRTAKPGVRGSARLEVSEAEALALLGHLVTSAELCMTEPYDYGIFRLIDAASRLGALLAPGSDLPERAWLEAFVATIDRGKMGSIRDREHYLAFLTAASRTIAEHLVERADAGSPSSPSDGLAVGSPGTGSADGPVGA